MIQSLLDILERKSLRIIYYHLIAENAKEYYNRPTLPPLGLRSQIRWLKKRYGIISLSEAIARAKHNEDLSRFLVITFDDGFKECYHYCAPILAEENVTATFFCITNCIDNSDLMWRNKLMLIENAIKKRNNLIKAVNLSGKNLLHVSDLWSMEQKETIVNNLWNESLNVSLHEWLRLNQPYLTKFQIQELLQNGFEIGSHTCSHPYCSKLTYDELEHEILQSEKMLNEKFNITINAMSYPFGDRPLSEIETKIKSKTSIECFLGIRDRYINHNNYSEWERFNMESAGMKVFLKFMLQPIKNYLFDPD